MSRTTKVVSRLIGLLLFCVISAFAYLIYMMFFDTSLTRALAEEKSFMQHAGTLYRLRPELRGQKGNLETWDEAEKIVNVSRSNGPQGTWATWSDQLGYLPQALRLDPSKHPMCVIRINQDVYVVRGVKKQVDQCKAVQPGFAVKNVQSGELVPSSDKIAEIYFERVGSATSTMVRQPS